MLLYLQSLVVLAAIIGLSSSEESVVKGVLGMTLAFGAFVWLGIYAEHKTEKKNS